MKWPEVRNQVTTHATRRFGSGRNVKSVASINARRGPGDTVSLPQRGPGQSPGKFRISKQTLESVKTFANLGKNNKIKLE